MVMKSETFLDKMFEFQRKAHIHPENFTILLKQLIIGITCTLIINSRCLYIECLCNLNLIICVNTARTDRLTTFLKDVRSLCAQCSAHTTCAMHT